MRGGCGRTKRSGYRFIFEGTGRHFGFLNPLLYSPAGQGALRDIRPAYSAPLAVSVFDPLELTTFDYRGPQNSLATAPGFDDVTGLGSPDGVAFLAALRRRGRL
jgi:hypothetical protein